MNLLLIDTHLPLWLFVVVVLAMILGGYVGGGGVVARVPSSRCPGCGWTGHALPGGRFGCYHCGVRWKP